MERKENVIMHWSLDSWTARWNELPR